MSEDKTIHLLRGSPSVRSWSKYQTTVPDWTLCGIARHLGAKTRTPTPATENADEVTCRYCQMLMRTSRKTTKAAIRRKQARTTTAG